MIVATATTVSRKGGNKKGHALRVLFAILMLTANHFFNNPPKPLNTLLPVLSFALPVVVEASVAVAVFELLDVVVAVVADSAPAFESFAPNIMPS